MLKDVRYPNVSVKLSETDGNAMVIIARVSRELRREGVSDAECEKFQKEATSGDYDNVLQTCMRWVEVE